ncbi:MAG: type II secretion system F family protein, partial [Deltaproteobacteria bacterium]
MPSFAFHTITAAGQRARGHASASDAAAMVRDLEARGLTVLRVEERTGVDGALARMPRRAVTDAVRAIASLLPAGLPIARAVNIASRTAPHALTFVLRDLQARVERGEGVAAAMAAHPSAFSPAAVGIVRAGERAGDLDGAFERLASHLERADALRARLLSAAIYPAVLAVAGGAAMLVLLLFVLPRFANLLSGTGMPIPRSTALLLALATTLRANWVALPLLIAGLLTAFAWMRQSTAGHHAWSRLLLDLPVFGAFRRDMLSAENARTLGVLLKGGAPIAAALDDAARSADDLATDPPQAPPITEAPSRATPRKTTELDSEMLPPPDPRRVPTLHAKPPSAFTGESFQLVDEGNANTSGQTKKVLLVEDEDSLRRVLKDLLEREGFTVYEAADGVSALDQIDRMAPDIVVLDLNLPRLDGYGVLSHLRARPATANL